MELTDGNLSLVNVESTGGYVVAVRVIEGYLPPQLMSPFFSGAGQGRSPID